MNAVTAQLFQQATKTCGTKLPKLVPQVVREHAVRQVSWLVLCLPITLAVICYTTFPFSDAIIRKTLSLEGLSTSQKSNIQLAAQAVNGVVLRPGETFSFNKVVGPRTEARGYRKAPSYLGPENPATVGGGICLMSSAVYQAALESGCQIEQRLPHLRTIRTVLPGLDATVWYGQADLRFKNTLDYPIRFDTSWTKSTVTVALLGRKPDGFKPSVLQRVVTRQTRREVVVELFRRHGHDESLISRDHYVISQ